MAQGGKRKGAGRKTGTKNKSTLEKERVLAELRQRIMRHADILFDAQVTLARGQTFLYKIEKIKIVGPKGGVSYVRQRPELVTSQVEIEAYLEGLLTEGDPDDEKDPGASYYYLTTKEPNNQALDSMFNRALGKPVESHEVSGKNGEAIVVSISKEIADKNGVSHS